MLVANGRTDLVTTFFESRLAMNRLAPMGNEERVRLRVYPGGHMFYTREDSRAALTADARAIIEGRTGG